MKYGLRPYSKALAAYRNSMHKDLAEWEIRRAGVANELITSNRAREMGDVTDYTYGTSRFEKGVQRISDYMGDLTFMNPWNDTWKMKAGIYVQDAVLRASKEMANTGKITGQNLKAMRTMGISDSMVSRFGREFLEHGNPDDDLFIANTKAWGDQEAVVAFRNSIGVEVNKTVVTPGVGDMPNIVGSPVSKMLLQFKSFPLAAHTRVTAAGLQQADAAAYSGFLMSTVLGMGVYASKAALAGKADQLSEDSYITWTLEGMDRSGITGIFFEGLNLANHASGGAVMDNLYSILGEENPKELSRYAQRNTLNKLIGPSGGLVEDLFSVSQGALGSEWTEGNSNALRRSMPYQNVFYLRGIIDKVQGKE
jgi:hypothetical protein